MIKASFHRAPACFCGKHCFFPPMQTFCVVCTPSSIRTHRSAVIADSSTSAPSLKWSEYAGEEKHYLTVVSKPLRGQVFVVLLVSS